MDFTLWIWESSPTGYEVCLLNGILDDDDALDLPPIATHPCYMPSILALVVDIIMKFEICR